MSRVRFSPSAPQKRASGCGSVVERLLAKEKVASSILVTRSDFKKHPLDVFCLAFFGTCKQVSLYYNDEMKKLKENLTRKITIALIILLAMSLFMLFEVIFNSKNNSVATQVVPDVGIVVEAEESFVENITQRVADVYVPTGPDVPPPPSMERMKKQGCVADGLFNGYGGDTKNTIKMINRSNCYYLHRSIETWLDPPDFKDIKKNMKKVKKGKELVYGMFIAEAIDTKADYFYPAEDRDFDFSKMCKSGSKNFWGEHTCRPSLTRSEYRKYLRFITEQAMDLGVQSFMFGQIYYQDSVSEPIIPQVIKEMREYASFKGMEIIIGAQTNDIDDEKYLRNFDFIEGGVGVDGRGGVENGPCFSRWWQKEGDWCWALLWHEKYSQKANNVFVHLDWSGRKGDDMSTFALMNRSTRHKTLVNLHAELNLKISGF